MAVRIVRDYWTNVNSYQTLIKRCFMHLYRKFPNPQDGIQDSFQELMIRLYELDVFSRFDPRRVLAANKGLSKKQAKGLAKKVSVEKAEVELQKRGVNVDKKFEQFVYKWIEHVMGEAYHKRVNHQYRYVTSGDIDFHITDMQGVREKFNENSWAQTPEEQEYLQRHIINKSTKRLVRQYPTPGDIGEIMGSKVDDPLDEVVAKDLEEKIRREVPSKDQRALYDYTLDGLSGADVGTFRGKTPQQIHYMLKDIRSKTMAVVG